MKGLILKMAGVFCVLTVLMLLVSTTGRTPNDSRWTDIFILIRSGTILPLLAIATAFGIISVNFATKKK